MIDRRQFLFRSAASVPMLAMPLAAVAGKPRFPFDAVIIDERLGGNEVLSRAARASGVQCVSIRGDLTRLWFESLRGACVQRPTMIAGFTSDLDAEVMRAFARDVGYRQELRVEIAADGQAGASALRLGRGARVTVRQSGNSARQPGSSAPGPEAGLSRGLHELVDHYMNAPMQAPGQHAPAQLVAWAIAPIRG